MYTTIKLERWMQHLEDIVIHTPRPSNLKTKVSPPQASK